ncbi:MAG: hypothetical protein GEU95_00945 [Rhizobiales bacterium]|nr:hypothetical protein [Hyphomicrobiales bacterium]
MARQSILATACALAATVGTLGVAPAQSASPQPDAIEQWAHDFTVLTIAPDGAWGTATDPRVNRAIFLAISNCKTMSGKDIGCGAYQTAIRGGWSLAIRCGHVSILAADRDLAKAERRAMVRETELRERYVTDMPPCARVVTIDPNGVAIIPPAVGYSAKLPASR